MTKTEFKLKLLLIIIYLIFIPFAFYGQTVMFEQKAFDFIENNIDSFTFVYGDRDVKFNSKVNNLILSPRTFCYKDMAMHLTQFRLFETKLNSKHEKFLDYSDDSLYYKKRIYCETNSLRISGHKPFVKVFQSNDDNYKYDADLCVSVSNHFEYKDNCYVRVIIHVKSKFHSNEIWVKLDRNGNIIDYIQQHGVI